MERLRDYINEEWIVEHRILCAVLCTKKYKKRHTSLFWTGREYSEEIPCVIKNRMQAGAIVKKDDIICEYAEKDLEKDNILIEELGGNIQTEKKITSPCDGVVYFIENEKSGDVKEQPDEYIAVYVVSYFDDYTEFSTWYKKKFNA